jgi:hypothetical protein
MSKATLSTANEPRRPAWFEGESASFAWEVAIVGVATLTGLVLRLYRLGAPPLSSQEIYTWDFAHQSVPFIVGRLSHIETNPPLYYLMMKLVMTIGETEFLLRLPSLIAGTLAIPLVYILGRLGGAPRSGVIGAGLVSLSAVAITWEPYDKVSEYLASIIEPGDTAVGTDGVIYYRRRTNAEFPYFKLVEGNTSMAQVTYGSPTGRCNQSGSRRSFGLPCPAREHHVGR